MTNITIPALPPLSLPPTTSSTAENVLRLATPTHPQTSGHKFQKPPVRHSFIRTSLGEPLAPSTPRRSADICALLTLLTTTSFSFHHGSTTIRRIEEAEFPRHDHSLTTDGNIDHIFDVLSKYEHPFVLLGVTAHRWMGCKGVPDEGFDMLIRNDQLNSIVNDLVATNN